MLGPLRRQADITFLRHLQKRYARVATKNPPSKGPLDPEVKSKLLLEKVQQEFRRRQELAQKEEQKGIEESQETPNYLSVDEQTKRILGERIHIMKGHPAPKGALWPDRPVDVKREFPKQWPREIEEESDIEGEEVYAESDEPEPEVVQIPKLKPKPPKDPLEQIVVVDDSPLKNKVTFSGLVPDFKTLGITSPSLIKILDGLKITAPTEIQCMVIPAVLEGGNLLIAAQTGTGKTLAFILPLIQTLKAYEAQFGFRRRGQRSRAIILVPSRELVEQHVEVLTTCLKAKEYSHMKVAGIAGGLLTEKKEAQLLTNGLDFLVCTPERLSAHLEAGHFYVDDTQFLVIDEADTMWNVDSFKIQLLRMVHLIHKATESKFNPMGQKELRMMWMSATISCAFSDYIAELFPETKEVFAPSLHLSVDKLKQNFIYGSFGDFKKRLLVEVPQKHKGKRTIIFCNKVETAKLVFSMLQKKGYNISVLARDTKAKRRSEFWDHFSMGKTQILVTTDLASRGIDTRVTVDHVILYDFPNNVIDYIHRIGRTARAGKAGVATSFIGNADQSLATKIRNAFEQRKSLAYIAKTRKGEKKSKAKNLQRQHEGKAQAEKE